MSEQSHERDYMRNPSAREQQEKEAAEQRKLEEAKQRGEETEENK